MEPEQQDGFEDRELSAMAARLKQPERAPGLWEWIEADLRRMQGSTPLELHRMRRRSLHRRVGILAAAVLLLCFVPILLRSGRSQAPSLILGSEEVARAETEQAKLERELARLEPVFREELAARGAETAALSGQLAYLDANIETCRRAWQGNRLNRRVQGSLLFGYRKKLDLLHGFLSGRD
jgi:hypothetical protein